MAGFPICFGFTGSGFHFWVLGWHTVLPSVGFLNTSYHTSLSSGTQLVVFLGKCRSLLLPQSGNSDIAS